MQTYPWQHNRTAPWWIRILAVLAGLSVLFFILHTVINFVFATEIDSGRFYVAPWTYELYYNVWIGAPLFLMLAGTSMRAKKAGKVLLTFVVLFGICYLLNIGNAYEWVDIRHLQYPMSIFLLGIITTWCIIVAKRKKTALDALKFLWLLGLIYSFIVPRFVAGGHQAGNFLMGSMIIFPFMMAVGLVKFYRKPKPEEHAA